MSSLVRFYKKRVLKTIHKIVPLLQSNIYEVSFKSTHITYSYYCTVST